METGTKVAVGVGIGIAAGGIALYLITKPPPEPTGEPRVEIGLAWGANPTFEPGSTHYAHVTITNPTDSGWDYCYNVYVHTYGYKGSMYLAPGESRTDDYSFKMPMEAGTYPCYVDVRASEAWHPYFLDYEHDLGRFDFDSVTIPELPPPPPEDLIGNVRLLWREPMPLTPFAVHTYDFYFTNPTDEILDYEYEIFVGGESPGSGTIRGVLPHTTDGGEGRISGLYPGTYTVWITFRELSYGVDLGRFDFPSIEIGAPAVPAADVGWAWD